MFKLSSIVYLSTPIDPDLSPTCTFGTATVSPPFVVLPSQKDWDAPSFDHPFRCIPLYEQAYVINFNNIILMANSGYEWLDAIPSSNVGPHDWGTGLGGNAVVLSICNDCGQPIESNAYHPLHCKFSRGRQPRHKSINNILLATLKKVNIRLSSNQWALQMKKSNAPMVYPSFSGLSR
ncbi:unnamed protein product [Gordionus sp. m RMFG-2023]